MWYGIRVESIIIMLIVVFFRIERITVESDLL
jgi:hypothetical protein